ncbi:isochorismatase family protein [bacterium]|nr:isochorismatase family protein [bacterium]
MNYFTEKNIKIKSKEFLEQTNHWRRPFRFSPAHTALLIIDMQDFFLDSRSHAYVESAWFIIPKINELADLFFKIGQPVITTRHINNEQNAGMMSKWWADMITEDNQYSAIHMDFQYDDAIVLTKSQYDAFYNSELDEILKKNNIKQLIITGVLTHLCCETTARSGFVRGYEIFFPVDGAADYDETFHSSTLYNLSHGFAHIVLIEEIISQINE